MAVVTPREAWTDERLDDLKTHLDEGFREVRADLRQQRGEMARQKDMDARFDALNRTMQIGFSVIGGVLAVIGAVLVGLIGLIGTQL
ncbi:MAG: hypothetical protein QOF06_259 [Solirubrobacterales bacterium]|jgi:hypothetical protein|nr:hypothetical protein [Solirubrobacterales bacterium]